jgi:hypothetical protein
MRGAAAVFATLVLLGITALCPQWVCAPEEAANTHSCCPESQQQTHHTHNPCDATSQTCPYLLLQKSKAVALALPVLAPGMISAPTLQTRFERVAAIPSMVRDSAGLYLRNHVLLI